MRMGELNFETFGNYEHEIQAWYQTNEKGYIQIWRY